MSDETSKSPTGHGDKANPESQQDEGAETSVGDMTAEGQTEIGPHPELTHVENLGQADLDAVAEDAAEGNSPRDE
jgi:hypothetical protein